MLTILPVSNTAHLPTKPDSPTKLQKLEDGEQNQNQASSLQLRQN